VRDAFHASSEYEVIFTANASSAMKLVGEAFPFAQGSSYVLAEDSHNSVHGIRVFAEKAGAHTVYIPSLRTGGLDVVVAEVRDVTRILHGHVNHSFHRTYYRHAPPTSRPCSLSPASPISRTRRTPSRCYALQPSWAITPFSTPRPWRRRLRSVWQTRPSMRWPSPFTRCSVTRPGSEHLSRRNRSSQSFDARGSLVCRSACFTCKPG
jgi:hypothetical protein